jgi:hypothetical protein
MVQTKMGRYWEQAKGWFFRKVWPLKTFAKRKKAARGYSAGYTGSAIKTNYGGVELSNPSYEKYYKGMI